MEEDEEVVLEGGSLHQYLDAIGFQDYETMPSQNKADENSKLLENHFMRNLLEANINEAGSFRWMVEAFLGVSHVEASFLECVSSKVINSKLLEEEDLLILETMSPTIQQFSTNPQQLLEEPTKLDQPAISLVKLSSCYVLKHLKWVSLMVPLLCLKTVWEFPVIICFCTVFITLTVFLICYRYYHLYLFKSTLNKLEETLTILGRCNRVINKSCKFFNEMSSIKKIIQHAPNSLGSWEGCHDSYLFEGSSQLLESLSSLLISSHLQLVSSKISSGHNIHPLFSDVFKKSVDFDADCGRDECSILKIRRNLTFLHISSFLTELFLCYEASKELSVFKSILPSAWAHIKSSASSLERTLRLCNKYRLQEEPIFKEIIKSSKSFEKLKFDVKGAVDNLSVHCKLIAYSALHLKDSLELAEDPLPPDFYQIIIDTCEKLQNEIVSCSACLEDVVEKNDNYFNCKLEKSEKRYLPSLSGLKEEDECKPHPSSELELCGLSDPVIEDEFFEIVSNSEKPDCSGNSKDDDWVENTKIERQVRKKQRERCKRVLQEIQPILQKRREMWHEREMEALKRMEVARGKVTSDSLPSPHLMDSGINSPVVSALFPEASEDTKDCFSVPVEIARLPCHDSEVMQEAVCQERLLPNLKEEIDSEEENLAAYRRVREELDRDEARRRVENSSSDESDSDLETGGRMRKGRTARPKDLFHIAPPMPVSVLSLPGAKSSCVKNINDHSNRIAHFTGSSMEISESKGFHVAPCLGLEQFEGESSRSSIITSDSPDPSSPKTSINHLSGEIDCMEEESTLPLSSQGEGEASQNETQFLCGDSDDEEKSLDWSSCGFSLQREREERGESLFSGLPLILEGLKVPPQLGKEEVFGGVGEGEGESEESS